MRSAGNNLNVRKLKSKFKFDSTFPGTFNVEE